METHWPDLIYPNDPRSFWLREYAKHGSCVIGFQNPKDYFRKALAILKEIGEVTTMQLPSGSINLRYTFFLSFCNSLFTIEKR